MSIEHVNIEQEHEHHCEMKMNTRGRKIRRRREEKRERARNSSSIQNTKPTWTSSKSDSWFKMKMRKHINHKKYRVQSAATRLILDSRLFLVVSWVWVWGGIKVGKDRLIENFQIWDQRLKTQNLNTTNRKTENSKEKQCTKRRV